MNEHSHQRVTLVGIGPAIRRLQRLHAAALEQPSSTAPSALSRETAGARYRKALVAATAHTFLMSPMRLRSLGEAVMHHAKLANKLDGIEGLAITCALASAEGDRLLHRELVEMLDSLKLPRALGGGLRVSLVADPTHGGVYALDRIGDEKLIQALSEARTTHTQEEALGQLASADPDGHAMCREIPYAIALLLHGAVSGARAALAMRTRDAHTRRIATGLLPERPRDPQAPAATQRALAATTARLRGFDSDAAAKQTFDFAVKAVLAPSGIPATDAVGGFPLASSQTVSQDAQGGVTVSGVSVTGNQVTSSTASDTGSFAQVSATVDTGTMAVTGSDAIVVADESNLLIVLMGSGPAQTVVTGSNGSYFLSFGSRSEPNQSAVFEVNTEGDLGFSYQTDSGRLTSITGTNAAGEVVVTFTFEYNSAGQVTSITQTNSKGEKVQETGFGYYSDETTLSSTRQSSGGVTTQTNYDEKGEITSQTLIDENGEITQVNYGKSETKAEKVEAVVEPKSEGELAYVAGDWEVASGGGGTPVLSVSINRGDPLDMPGSGGEGQINWSLVSPGEGPLTGDIGGPERGGVLNVQVFNNPALDEKPLEEAGGAEGPMRPPRGVSVSCVGDTSATQAASALTPQGNGFRLSDAPKVGAAGVESLGFAGTSMQGSAAEAVAAVVTR
ncbi:MAG: hypothetical protein ACTHM1_10245 [Solirubrobacteraceae bacterium]